MQLNEVYPGAFVFNREHLKYVLHRLPKTGTFTPPMVQIWGAGIVVSQMQCYSVYIFLGLDSSTGKNTMRLFGYSSTYQLAICPYNNHIQTSLWPKRAKG